MRKLLYLTAMFMVAALIFAPTALSESATCSNFTYQEQAQAALPANPQLDRDKDGVACEDLPHMPGGQQPMAQGSAMVEQTTMIETTQPAEMPETGGLAIGPLMLTTGALLLGAGIVAYTVLRRR